MFIAQIIIDHAPDGCISGTGDHCNDLNRVLAVKHIIDPVSAADLYRIDLMKIKVRCSTGNMRLRQIPLIFLIGYEVLDRYFFKVHIRYVAAVGIHYASSLIAEIMTSILSRSSSRA